LPRLEVVLQVEQGGEGVADEFLVVGHHYSNHETGTVTSSV
jgi:hypothetical protein